MPPAKKAAPVKKIAGVKKDAGPKRSAFERGLDTFTTAFEKSFGEGTLSMGTEDNVYEVIPTGALSLDFALGVGGIVRGRMTEIYGPDGIGKTTLALNIIREAQRAYPSQAAFYVDMESTLDTLWVRVHGVDPRRLVIFRPNSAEDLADAVKKAIENNSFSIVVVDSIAAAIPEAEMKKDAGDATVGLQAKIVTRMVKIAAVMCRLKNTALVIINQYRSNIGYGADTTTGGGWALKYGTTHKLHVKKGETTYKIQVDGKAQPVGHDVAITVERNKVAPPFKRAEFVLFHTRSDKYGPPGIDAADDAATMGIKLGVIDQSGGWYTFPSTGEQVQGRDKVVEVLRGDQLLRDEIRTECLKLVADSIVTGEAAEPELDLSALAQPIDSPPVGISA